MRRRTTLAEAVFYGGGPADGERRAVEPEATIAVIAPAPYDAPPAWLDDEDEDAPAPDQHGHLYERQDDGRFRYAGVVQHVPELPEAVHADPRELGLAALGHDKGPSALAILGVIVLVFVVMYCFSLYA